MKHRMWIFVLLLSVSWLTACNEGKARTLRLLTHESFAIGEEVIQAFASEHGASVEILPVGDAGEVLNQAILTGDEPLADLIFGIDNTFMSRALAAGILEAYASPALANVPDELELDPENYLTPIDYGDVCLNYDKAWFDERGLAVPQSLAALTEPDYRGLLVAQNPATSSPGLAFLLTSIAVFGETGDYTYLDYWADLRANDVRITNGWEDAYYGDFTVGGGGDRPLVVSYASSPPAEVYFAETTPATAPTASITAPGTCFRQVEFVGILRGTQNQALAQQFVDFMLSREFQEDIPLNMFVFPANEQAALPEVFVQWAAVPDQPVQVDTAAIEAHRESWIDAWTEVVLR